MSDEERLSNCTNWFALNDEDGSQNGPFDLNGLIQSNINASTSVWCEFLPGWLPAGDVPVVWACLLQEQNGDQSGSDPSGGHPSPAADSNECSQEEPVEPEQHTDIESSFDNLLAQLPPVKAVALPTNKAALTRQPSQTLRPAVQSSPTATKAALSSAPTAIAATSKPQPDVNASGNTRVDAAFQVMDAEFAALAHRRVPLMYPVLDLNRFVDDLERTAFMGCSEEFIISQIYNEIVKERTTFIDQSTDKHIASHTRFIAQFNQQTAELMNSIAEQANAMERIVDTVQQAIKAELSGTSSAQVRLDATRVLVRTEIAYLRKVAERHATLLQHPSMFVYFKTTLLTLMQLCSGIRFVSGASGPAKERYKLKIASDPLLVSLVKKGIDVLGSYYVVPKGDSALQALSLLDDHIQNVHANHVVLKIFFSNCSQFARLAAGIQTCADTVAQTLAFRYEEQIRLLTTQSSIMLGEVGSRAMFAMLTKGIPKCNAQSPLVSFLVASVQDDSTLAKLGSKRFAKKDKLETIRSGDTWNAVGIYRKSGVRIHAMGRARFFEGGMFDGSPAKYGYRLGTEPECLALAMVETPVRSRVDMEVAPPPEPTSGQMQEPAGQFLDTRPANHESRLSQVSQMSAIDSKLSTDFSKLQTDELSNHKLSMDHDIGYAERIQELETNVALLQNDNDALHAELDYIRSVLVQAGMCPEKS